MSIRFTEAERARRMKTALATLRETGSLRKAGVAAGVSYELVRRWAAAAGIAPNPRGRGHDKATKQAALRRLAAGEATEVVAQSIGATTKTIRRWRNAASIAPPPRRTKTRRRGAEIVALRQQGLTIKAVAKQLSLSSIAVWRHLRGLGLTTPRAGGQ